MTRLELTGLKGHHPLGFLAACGLLRCCNVEGKCEVKLAWKQADEGSGWIAVLQGVNELALTPLIEMLIAQARKQQSSDALKWSNKIDDVAKYRQTGWRLIQGRTGQIDDESLALLPAFCSDLVLNKDKLQPTLLDLTSGAQRFLESIRELAVGLSKEGRTGAQTAECVAAFRDALCGPWRYSDGAHSLGWDPQTQRLHALRHKLPEKDKEKRSVRGAVFLASQALPLFPCFAVNAKLRTTGFYRDGDAEWFSWPIWREPMFISLDTLRCLLAQPLHGDLIPRGVEVVYRCRRVRTGGSEGNYQVFSSAEEDPRVRT